MNQYQCQSPDLIKGLLLGLACISSMAASAQVNYFYKDLGVQGRSETRIYGITKTLSNKLLMVGVQDGADQSQNPQLGSPLMPFMDMRLLQTNLDGDVTFDRFVGSAFDDRAFESVRTNLGEMMVVGHTGQGFTHEQRIALGLPKNEKNAAVAILRVANDGSIVSQKNYDLGGFDDHAFSLVRKSSDAYFVLGRSLRAGSEKNAISFMQVNGSGDMVAASILHDGFANDLMPRKMIRTNDGGYLIAAVGLPDYLSSQRESPDPIDNAAHGDALLLVKLDVSETIVFSKWVKVQTPNSSTISIQDMVEDQNGNVCLVGVSSEGNYILKINAGGVVLQSKKIASGPGLINFYPYSVIRNGGGFTVSGHYGPGHVPRLVLDANLNVLDASLIDANGSIVAMENVTGGLQYMVGSNENATEVGLLIKRPNGLSGCREEVKTVALNNFPLTVLPATVTKEPTPFRQLDNVGDGVQSTDYGAYCATMAKTSVEIGGSHLDGPTTTFYPNPAHDRIQLDLPGEGPFDIELFDLQGRLLMHFNLPAGQHDLSVADLESGVYLLRIQGAAGQRTHKLRIQH